MENNLEIDEKLKQAYALIEEAEQIAIKEGVNFSFSLEYGMGGTFYAKENPYYTDGKPGWVSSSAMC